MEANPFAVADARLERKLLLVAPPAAMAIALILTQLDTWRMLSRTFLTMWVHELGHATSSWFAGRWALPGPWVTRLGEGQSLLVITLVAAVIAWIGYRGWVAARRWQIGLAGVLLATQLWCTLVLDDRSKDALITFFGDGGMLVLGAVLMLTFWSSPESKVHRDWLRWGFLVIGAFAFADALTSWWQASGDASTIPYGEIEGVGHSDPTKLVFDYGWTQAEMISRYLWLAAACAAAVIARYGWELRPRS